MEPGERRLTWDLHGNVPEILCFINSKLITKAIDKNRYCQFHVLPLCEVKNFTISLTKGPPFLMGIQYPLQERLSSPNITATCNKSYSMMEWKVLSHVNLRFEYELQIQKGRNPAYTEKLQENFFQIHNPGNYMARLKVKGFFRNTWSEWSVPQNFVCDLGEDSQPPGWLLTALVLLGTLLVPGLVVVLCGRYSVLQKLFPPIPHMKDPIADNLQNSKLVAWETSRASREDCPVAEVQVLGET
ncbi:hypothetical protein GH733_016285 [Mirounga leonina]|nr:hypothetical protein GH733_016285 [Mirounga leonina]